MRFGLVLNVSLIFLISAVTSGVRLVTYNAGLMERIPKYNQRKLELIKRLKQDDYDVMCLQEVWYNEDLEAIEEAMVGRAWITHAPIQSSVKYWPCKVWFLLKLYWKCRKKANDLMELGKCAVSIGLMNQQQECITCIMVAGFDTRWRCVVNVSFRQKWSKINIPGLVIISKKKPSSWRYEPFDGSQKMLQKKGALIAKIYDLDIICTHMTSNISEIYFNPGVEHLYSSWEEQNLSNVREVLYHTLAMANPVIMGDLNTGPKMSDINPENAASFDLIQKAGFKSLYIDTVGNCTYCRSNPYVADTKENANTLIDHILTTNVNQVSTELMYHIPQTLMISDHFGVVTEVNVP